MEFIDLKAQYQLIRGDIDANIKKVLDHGRFILGPEVSELESRLATFVGVDHCVSVSSGTDALLIALMALDIQPGDEVITTPFSFIAPAEAIVLLGAKPVFVDIDPRTYNIAPELIEAAITERTVAIMPVSLFGQCAAFDPINEIAKRHELTVIEDAAQSFGATYQERKSCALSTIACTSFFPSKPLGAYGDGGACFTDDEALAQRMREVRVHGEARRYHHLRLGLNGRLDTLQAAILLAKLDVFEDEVNARDQIGQRYDTLIAAQGIPVTPPYIAPGNRSVYAQYTVQVDERDAVQTRLADAGVPTAVHYPVPIPRQPVLQDLGFGKIVAFPLADAVASRVVSLPMHPYLEESIQTSIVDLLAAQIRQHGT